MVVVQSQPAPVVARTVIRRLSSDHYLTLSIVLTFLCLFLGTWYSLFCTIPAIIIAINVSVLIYLNDNVVLVYRPVTMRVEVTWKKLNVKLVLL